ncbi:MAG: hypothetical protein M3Q71_11795 [Chloroflexota bacterium]|nr:hypothetical protein [Chloroflexota bacterium]
MHPRVRLVSPIRRTGARLSSIAFVGLFAAYTTAAVIWLAVGLAPAFVRASPSLHDTLHSWADGQQVIYLEISDWDPRFAERRVWAPWATETQELTLRAGQPTVIHFLNEDRGARHNLSIYTDASAREVIFQGPVLDGPASGDDEPARTVYRFTAPSSPGTYYFRSDVDLTMNGTVNVVASHNALQSAATREITGGIATASHIAESVPAIALQYLFSLGNLVLGIFLVRLRPRDWAARLLAVGMVGTGAIFNLQSHGVEYLTPVVRQMHEMFHIVSGVAYAGALMLFPDGRIAPRWSTIRWLKWPLCLVYVLFFAFFGWLFSSTIHGDPGGFVAFFGVIIPIIGITSQALRYRHAASAEERQQSRVLMWSLTLAFVMTLLWGATLLIAWLGSEGRSVESVATLQRFVFLVFPPLFAIIPLLLFVLMIRYRLWDIDRVVNRALVYGLLTGILGVTYMASVVGLGGFLTTVVGQRANTLVVAASTLAVAASFRPARSRIQGFIDRRFDRAKYDAARTLATFGAAVRDEVDLNGLTDDLLGTVERALHPAQVSLWLRPLEQRGDRGP